MGTIDVSRQVAEMERVLRSRESTARSLDALAVLDRWQWDDMLDTASRTRARRLVREFGSLGDPLRGLSLWGSPSVRPRQRAHLGGGPAALAVPRDQSLRVRVARIGAGEVQALRPSADRIRGDLRPPRRTV